LGVLERREVMRLGGSGPVPIDVRFISATHVDLEQAVKARHFRQDLFFRLNGICLAIPPLRERPSEIEGLAREFIHEAARVAGRPAPEFPESTLAALRVYRWPGNVRELRNAIERAVALCSGELLLREHLALGAAPDVAADLRAPGEKQRIIDALGRCAGNQRRAAELLGISRRTLVNRLKTYGIARPRSSGPR
jgi:two-component system, NtrC family, response regulator AtoC